MSTKTEPAIKKEMTIGDILSTYPYAADVMTRHGIHCVGCGAATFETLEQGLAVHGKTTEELEALVDELNALVLEMDGALFVITERAARIILDVMKEESPEASFLRIKIVPGGCSGFQYEFLFEEQASEEDTLIEKDGLQVALGPQTLPLITGSRLDYVMGVQGSGLKIHNPNASDACGCGNSFGG
ncbi:iron-sulfur cluster assembly accessory protein [bacterium]|nr:iron-sulfur cluster assembly accessory protein [bacterium]